MIRSTIDLALGGMLFSAIMIGTAALAIGLKLARSGR